MGRLKGEMSAKRGFTVTEVSHYDAICDKLRLQVEFPEFREKMAFAKAYLENHDCRFPVDNLKMIPKESPFLKFELPVQAITNSSAAPSRLNLHNVRLLLD